MDLHAFFANEVKPALGCTEPGAVALACAAAARRLSGAPRHIHLRLSANIYKNGMSVGIPGAEGARGIPMAAALGALAGDPDKGLMALEGIGPQDIEAARAFVEAGKVTHEVARDVPSVYVEAELLRQGESVTAVVAHAHDLLAEIRQGREVVHQADTPQSGGRGASPAIRDLLRLSFEDIWALAGTIPADLEAFLLEGAAMNLGVARQGLARPWGLATGYRLAAATPAALDADLLRKVRAMAAAAADVRMAGGPSAVMSSAGSGNHGLTAVIPPAVVAEALGSSPRELAEALALSHLVTGYVKARTGRLTPVCGCAMAAGAGAAAAIARLLGGTPAEAENAVAILLSAVLGMICDGAKGTCALKVATASAEAYLAAELARAGLAFSEPEGFVRGDFPRDAEAVGEISNTGFAAVDGVVLRLMEQAHKE